jgi:hypothetical protein
MLECLPTASHFHPSLMFAEKAWSRLRWKQLTVTKTLAYYASELITVVKSFTKQTT